MTTIKRIFILVACGLLIGCASPREMLGWPADVPFELAPQQTSEFATAAPLFSKGLADVSFFAGRVCLTCGDFSDTNGIGLDHIDSRIKRDFPALLKQQVPQTTLFPRGAQETISLRVTLTDLAQQSSVGAAAERKSVLTSGAVLTTKVSLLYELLDKGQVVESWAVTTSARSNSLAASTRLSENIDGALLRNLRSFLLRIVVDHSPNDSERAGRALASLQSEVDNKRIALAYLVYGATKTVTTTAGVVGDGLTFVGQNSGAIAAGLNSTAAQMDRSNREYNQASSQALLASRQQQVASTSPPAARSNQSTSTAQIASGSPAGRASTTPARTSTASASSASSSSSAPPVTPTPTESRSATTSRPSTVYQCPSSRYFASLIRFRDIYKKIETSTFEEACERVNREASDFAASVGSGGLLGTYRNAKVTNIEACRKSKSGDQAVVYVRLTSASSEPCDASRTGISR